MSEILPTSRWSEVDLRWAADFLNDQPPYSLYFQCQRDALKEGNDNRGLYIGRGKKGVILSIAFDGADIFTTFGHLEADELLLMIGSEKFSELHVDELQAQSLLRSCAARLQKVDGLLYYRYDPTDLPPTDARCRLLTVQDFEVTKAFFQRHYPETIFSSWMLELPFVGLFESKELVATGGTIIWHEGVRLCNIGNFLTHPEHRGRGLARIVARHLIAVLIQKGIKTFTLGTNELNLPAKRLYESIGFKLLERRQQIDLRGLPKK